MTTQPSPTEQKRGRTWGTMIDYLVPPLYFIAFGVLTAISSPASQTVIHMSEVWGVDILFIELLFVGTGIGLFLIKHPVAIAVAFFVQWSYFAALTWVVVVNGLSPTAIVQSLVTTICIMRLITLEANAAGEVKQHGTIPTGR